jgi:drug/metabolite transporter (DMT)-like permease
MKNAMVGAALLAIVAPQLAGVRPSAVTSRRVAGLVALGVIGGSVPFAMFFAGLKQADAGSAAFIQKTLFVWVGVFAFVVLRERIGIGQLGAIGLLLLSQLILGAKGVPVLGPAATLILGATLFWSVEVVIAKLVLPDLGALSAATGRMAIGGTLLIGYVVVTGRGGNLAHLGASQWGWLAVTGVLLLTYVLSWYGALRRAPATAVTCLLTIGAPITAALSYIAGKGAPSPQQLEGYGLLILALAAYLAAERIHPRRTQPHPVPARAS